MGQLKKHWTEESTTDFLYRVGADFVGRIEGLLGAQSKASLAKKLGVSAGRISQVLNNPGNLTLRTMIAYARALGLKIAVVVYDDNDPKNLNGPVDAEIFEQCWVRSGKPLDFFALNATTLPELTVLPKPHAYGQTAANEYKYSNEYKYLDEETASSTEQPERWRIQNKGYFYGRTDTNQI